MCPTWTQKDRPRCWSTRSSHGAVNLGGCYCPFSIPYLQKLLRADLAAQIILALDRMYAGYPEDRGEYLKKYRAGCITTGHQVQLITPTARRQAFALEIDDNFNLVVEHYNGKRETISAGEVSVRGMYGYV